jgi:hypothetical protein
MDEIQRQKNKNRVSSVLEKALGADTERNQHAIVCT